MPQHDSPIPCEVIRIYVNGLQLWAEIRDAKGVSKMPYGTYLRLAAIRHLKLQQAEHEWSCI